MALWFLLGSLTILTLGFLALPFLASEKPARSGGEFAVYQDQLSQLERERDSGLIDDAGESAARVEISRRLLRAHDSDAHDSDASDHDGDREAAGGGLMPTKSSKALRYAVLSVGLIAVPAFAGGMYVRLGSPAAATVINVAERTQPFGEESVEAMVSRVEKYLKSNPNDGHAWEVLAPVYMRVGSFEEAVRAWQNALTILGENSDRDENLGEALVAAANGVVTQEAKAQFDRAVALDNTTVTARFYLGLAAKQDGRREDASKIWRDLIAEAPSGAPWIDSVKDALARVDEADTPAESQPASSSSSVASPPEQNPQIRGMVERLAARLKTDGGDVDSWIKLLRSYRVMGDQQKLDQATADMRRNFAADSKTIERIEAAAKSAPSEADDSKVASQSPPVTSSPEQSPQIRGMVERLAARLKTDGSDVDSWIKLLRSYRVMGDQQKLDQATADMRRNFAADSKTIERIETAAKTAPSETDDSPQPGKSASADTPAATNPPQDHSGAEVQSMVERLANRLKGGGGTAENWVMLVRSYRTLGENGKAETAIADARRALAASPPQLQQLEAALRQPAEAATKAPAQAQPAPQ